MRKNSPLKVQIEHQGAIIFNDATIIERSKNLIAVSLDFKSKYMEIDGIGYDEYPCIFIGATEETLYTNGDDRDDPTILKFPTMDGWDMFSYSTSRYSVHICFIKQQEYL